MSDAIKNGGVWLAKALADHEVWKLDPCSRGQAWADLLLLANDRERKFMVRGNLVTVCRGQLGWSKLNLAKRWRWSVDKLNGFLDYLETAGMVRVETSTLTTVISISNYESYQKHLDPVTDQRAEPVTDPVTDQRAEPVTDPVTDQRAEPVTDPLTDPRQKVEGRRVEEGSRKGATRTRGGHAPSLEEAIGYCGSVGMDYSEGEIRQAWREFEGSKDAEGWWQWGKRRASDWRVCLETRLGSNREKAGAASALAAGVSGMPGDLERWWQDPVEQLEVEYLGLAQGDEIQKKAARRIREILKVRSK